MSLSRISIAALAVVLGTGGASTSALARSRPVGRPPAILSARCAAPGICGADPAAVSPGGHLVLTGHLSRGMLIQFRARPNGRRGSRRARATLRAVTGALVVRVPDRARSGTIFAIDRYGRSSRPYGPITVMVLKRATTGGAVYGGGGTPSGTAFDGQGMWIWYLNKSEGGDIAAIGARAKQAGVTTVFVKSSDGSSNFWSQFSPANVAALKTQGLHVCAWQYVYGTHPDGEAAMGAQAVTNGAECLAIDAESEYEGRYKEAQTYVQDLRAKIGPDFPVALASFPYVDYHETLPYSVFLGPGAAQFNEPQMYWKAIGTSVDRVYTHTYVQNRVYQRTIFPLGQTYSDPSSADLVRFRQEASTYTAPGLSFWDWQETSDAGWAALAAPLTPLTDVTPTADYPLLSSGAKGDQVLWMQEHLATAQPATPTSATFDSATQSALETFQSQHSLPVTGQTDAATWQALLALAPVAVTFAR